jgi:hypothetical protein
MPVPMRLQITHHFPPMKAMTSTLDTIVFPRILNNHRRFAYPHVQVTRTGGGLRVVRLTNDRGSAVTISFPRGRDL